MKASENIRGRLYLFFGILIMAIGGVSGCGEKAARPLWKPARTYKNLVVVVIDSFRSDILTLDGNLDYKPGEMLLKYAKRSTLFENAYVQGTVPASSYTSLMSSTHVRTHGVSFPMGDDLPKAGLCGRKDLTFLPEVLKKHGFATQAAVSTRALYPKAGFPRGFDKWNRDDVAKFGEMSHRAGYRRLAAASDTTTLKMAESIIATWPKEKATKQFLYVHFAGPELPYAPSLMARTFLDIGYLKTEFEAENIKEIVEGGDVGEKSNIRLAYLAELWEANIRVYNLLHELKKQGVEDDTLVVVTGNRGVRFFNPEKNGVDDIFAKVPLILHMPGEAPDKVRRAVGHVDVAPTALRLLGIADIPKGWQGTDLFDTTRGPVITEYHKHVAVRFDAELGGTFERSGKLLPLNRKKPSSEEDASLLTDAYQAWLRKTPRGRIETSAIPEGMCK